MTNAIYFDGRSAWPHPVGIHALDGNIVLGGAVARRYRLDQTRMAEPFENAPTVLYFPDGARCEVSEPDARAQLAEALGYRASRVVRLQGHVAGVLASLVLLVLLIGAVTFWGIPAAAERIAAALPQEVDRTLGASGLAALEKQGLLDESRFSDERLAHLQALMRDMVPADGSIRPRLLVRDAPDIGPNALALPDGTIIITDQMVKLVIEEFGDDVESADAALAGILAHELGHVRLRHSTRAVTRASLTAGLSAALFGDFSAVAAGAPALLLNMEYSRENETQADSYAIERLRERGISTIPLAYLFEVLAENEEDALPEWLREVGSYVSSHPDGIARSERLREATPD